jgi:hypothetical protein
MYKLLADRGQAILSPVRLYLRKLNNPAQTRFDVLLR